MAKVQFAPPVTGISGSVGGWTFQTNRSGAIVRLRPKGRKTPEGKQSIAIADFSALVNLYSGLTPTQKQDWDDFSLVNTKVDRFGNVRTLTGQNWFISVNSNRFLFDLTVLESPPALLLPNGNTNFTADVDNVAIIINKTLPTTNLDTAYKIFTTGPLGLNTTSLQSELKLTQTILGDVFVVTDITALWETTHNCPWPPSIGFNQFTIGIQLQTMRKTSGITSAGNTQLSNLVDPPIGIGFWVIGTDFVVQ